GRTVEIDRIGLEIIEDQLLILLKPATSENDAVSRGKCQREAALLQRHARHPALLLDEAPRPCAEEDRNVGLGRHRLDEEVVERLAVAERYRALESELPRRRLLEFDARRVDASRERCEHLDRFE